MPAHPASFLIQQQDGSDHFVVVRNGEAVYTARSEDEAQTYIDTWRQVAARLQIGTGDALPIDAMTDEERKILVPRGDKDATLDTSDAALTTPVPTSSRLSSTVAEVRPVARRTRARIYDRS